MEMLNDISFKELIEEKTAFLVMFSAPWCTPCKQATPILEELSQSHDGVRFVKMDVEQDTKWAQELSVMSLPTVVLIADGKEIGRKRGFNGRKGYEDLLKEIKAN